MPATAPARLAASGETSCACTVHPAAARLRAMGKPIRPSPMKPTSPFAMRFLPKGELNASGRHASGDLALVHLAVLDLAAPGARLASAALDELLEALEVGLDARAHDTQRIGDVLHDALRLVVHLQHHLRALIVEPMEGDDAGVPGAAAARPRDALVGPLLDDLGVPLLFLAPDHGAPVQALVVELPNLLDALHEAREVLELRPLVVHRAERRVDFDRLLDGGHSNPSSGFESGGRVIATSVPASTSWRDRCGRNW